MGPGVRGPAAEATKKEPAGSFFNALHAPSTVHPEGLCLFQFQAVEALCQRMRVAPLGQLDAQAHFIGAVGVA